MDASWCMRRSKDLRTENGGERGRGVGERGRIFTFDIHGFASIDPPANIESMDLTLTLESEGL